MQKGELAVDPRGLIFEAYRMEIGPEDARTIFFDWALGLAEAAGPAEIARPPRPLRPGTSRPPDDRRPPRRSGSPGPPPPPPQARQLEKSLD